MISAVRSKSIEELRDCIHRLETSEKCAERSVLSTGFDALDRLFANRGLARGTLTEWLGEAEGTGAAALALTVAAHLLREEGFLVVIDRAGEFYPPAAAHMGIPVERTIIVRPDTRLSELWAWEQSLRCSGVAVTLGWFDAMGDQIFRRLQIAAETGGGLGFLLRPADCRAGPSWAATRMCVKSLPANSELHSLGRRLQVSLARRQVGCCAGAIELELDDEACHVPEIS